MTKLRLGRTLSPLRKSPTDLPYVQVSHSMKIFVKRRSGVILSKDTSWMNETGHVIHMSPLIDDLAKLT